MVLIGVLVAACAAAGDEDPPELTEEVAADLSARAIAIACEQQCVGNEVPIRDLAYLTVDPPVPGSPLTDVQRRAITQQFSDVLFLSQEEADLVVASDQVALVVGPVSETDDGEVEAQVLAVGSDSQTIYVLSYRWSGGEWVPTPS